MCVLLYPPAHNLHAFLSPHEGNGERMGGLPAHPQLNPYSSHAGQQASEHPKAASRSQLSVQGENIGPIAAGWPSLTLPSVFVHLPLLVPLSSSFSLHPVDTPRHRAPSPSCHSTPVPKSVSTKLDRTRGPGYFRMLPSIPSCPCGLPLLPADG